MNHEKVKIPNYRKALVKLRSGNNNVWDNERFLLRSRVSIDVRPTENDSIRLYKNGNLLHPKAYERVEAVVSRIVQWDNAGIYRPRFLLLLKYIIIQ